MVKGELFYPNFKVKEMKQEFIKNLPYPARQGGSTVN